MDTDTQPTERDGLASLILSHSSVGSQGSGDRGTFLGMGGWEKNDGGAKGLSQNGTTHQPSRTSSLVPPLKLWHNNMDIPH